MYAQAWCATTADDDDDEVEINPQVFAVFLLHIENKFLPFSAD